MAITHISNTGVDSKLFQKDTCNQFTYQQFSEEHGIQVTSYARAAARWFTAIPTTLVGLQYVAPQYGSDGFGNAGLTLIDDAVRLSTIFALYVSPSKTSKLFKGIVTFWNVSNNALSPRRLTDLTEEQTQYIDTSFLPGIKQHTHLNPEISTFQHIQVKAPFRSDLLLVEMSRRET